MRIVHIAPNAPYNEGWGYQENLLTKYQAKLGHEITLIVPNITHDNNRIVETECCDYVSESGFRVIRVPYRKHSINMLSRIFSTLPVLDLLDELKPDFIFYHGLASNTILDVIKYKRTHKCVVVQDNHLDYNIGYAKTIKNYLIRSYFKFISKITIKNVSKVYGVTPWREQYAREVYAVPKNKTDVLVMGADDEKIDFKNKQAIRKRIREKYGVAENSYLVVTGGKIDERKKIDILMRAVSERPNIQLLVFGKVSDDFKERFDSLLNDENIIYIGWINSDDVYNYFFAADLVFFPGQHSVLWEQACASKVPCVFEKWEGMDHVNNGGNCDFITSVNVENVSKKLDELYFTDKYYSMKAIAESEATDIFLYSKIAERSLECVYGK